MALQDILVHVKSYERWSPHIDVAGALAQRFKAHLTGLYTLRGLATLKLVYGRNASIVQARQAEEEKIAAEVEGRFRRLLAERAIAGTWTVGEGEAAEILAWAGRLHDLLVVEQTNLATDEVGSDTAEHCVLASGTPTLVVPHTGTFATIGETILVGWNGSRESALAVHAAMPLIETAKRVVVLTGEPKETLSTVTRFPEISIETYLRRHGAKLEMRRTDCIDSEAGRSIVEQAEKLGADLVVMGAYGRSWLRELVLGGATREVLRAMRVPVLMAH